MTKGRKRATGKRGSRKSKKRSWLWRLIVAGILLQTLVAVVIFVFLRPAGKEPGPPVEVGQGREAPIPYEEDGLVPEVATLDTPGKKHGPGQAEKPAKPRPETGDTSLPMIAIVIDDMGYQQQLGEELLRLRLDLTFAFLPHAPHSGQLADQARRQGRDILLHFPMEAVDQKWDSGPGTVNLDMSRARLRTVFEENLRQVPLAVGINNHMGSRFTQNHEAMRDFLELVAEYRLFFLDSMTSQSSIGFSLAREMGIKTARRQVFLDNVRERGAIVKQIGELLEVARKQGTAVGIGHPYPQTLEALRATRTEIQGRARVVGVSRLVR